MKVSKRKLIVLICILVFCIAIVCLLAYKTTEDFFPKPKKITCKYGSIEIELSDEQSELVYQKFAQMTASPVSEQEKYSYEEFCKNGLMYHLTMQEYLKSDEQAMVLEFKYGRRYRYSGALAYSDDSAFGSPFVFDRVTMVMDVGGILVIPSQYGVYYGFDKSTPFLRFEAGDNELYGVLTNLVAENIMQVDHQPNADVLEESTFLSVPDDVTVIKSGAKATITEEQKQEIYERFVKMMPNLKEISDCRCLYQPEDTLEYLTDKDGLCVELRYDQRRKFMGTLQGTEPGYKIELLEYDAMLLVVNYGRITVIAHNNGEYYGIENKHISLYFDGGISDFESFLAGL